MDEQLKGTSLSGYRVLDLTDEKGKFCIKLLADMGTVVTRIEKHDKDIPEGQKSVSLCLEEKTGQEYFRQLAIKADVLVETGPPGYLESLGLGYPALNRENPGLIMASITHFGQSGPYRDFKSCDLVAEALGGWLSVTGVPQAPLKLYDHQAYHTASLFAVNGILLALWHRHATGRGQHLDVSVMECVAATLDHTLVRYFYEDTVAGRQGSRHWNNAFDIFPCKDGYILLSLFQHWETLVAWLDSEGLAADLTDEKWRDSETRIGGAGHIAEVLKRWTLTHTVNELVEKGQLMHFPWAKVASPGVMIDG
jgi:crotonobetainyl-CoA:carnitine CoA-transferase CaiB-like acyl-CoA transferase